MSYWIGLIVAFWKLDNKLLSQHFNIQVNMEMIFENEIQWLKESCTDFPAEDLA